MYRDGRGVPQNHVLAYMWFSLAAARMEEQAEMNRDNLAKRMTSDDIYEAQKMVWEWKPKN